MKLLKIVVVIFLILFLIFGGAYYHSYKIKEIQLENKIKEKDIKKKYQKQYDDLTTLTDKVILDRESSIMILNSDITKLKTNISELESILQVKKSHNNLVTLINSSPNYKITAYDLSIQSCGKSRTSRNYGITASGYNLKGQNLRTASTISTDPNVIPLGSVVYLYFKETPNYNGIYISSDTGGGIKGNHIDLFLGDQNSNSPSKQALNFGIKYAKVILLDKI